MTANTQAASAGTNANAIIEQLSNPQAPIETDKTTVDVLDKAQPTPKLVAPEEDWKKRFTGYKASADSTIHKLRQKANQFDLTQSENAKLKQKLEEAKQAIPSTPDDLLKLFSKEELEGISGYVDDKVDGLQDKVTELEAELKLRREAEATLHAQQEHDMIVNAVKASVPDYDSIDRDPDFKAWIQEPDQFGNTRLELLVKAKQELPPDIGRIVSFYHEFALKKDTSAAPVAPAKPTIQELMQAPKTIQSGSNQSVAPRIKGKVWNTAESSQFYKDRALGKYSPEQAADLEADLYRSLAARKR